MTLAGRRFAPFALVLALAVVGCARLPATAVAESESERYFGGLNDGTPLAAVVAQTGIRPLDPASRQPLLDQLVRELRKTDPQGRFAGATYSLSRGNALDRDWLIQTPNRWGRKADDLPVYPTPCTDCAPDVALPTCSTDADCGGGGTCAALKLLEPMGLMAGRKVCLGHSDALVDRIYALVASARSTVDIAALQPAPDGRFLAALRSGVTTLARSGRAVTVRVLVGQYPPEGVDPKLLLKELNRDAAAVLGSRVSFQVAAMRSCTGGRECNSYSWNHAKIVSVDGAAAIVGGHNMWSRDYLIQNPVHDLSMQVRGPAATDAVRFVEPLWRFVCAHDGKGSDTVVASLAAGEQAPTARCLAAPAPSRAPAPAGRVAILSVGRLGAGVTTEFAQQSDLARDLLLGAARRSIRIAHQDLAFTLGRAVPLWPESTLERLVDFLLRDAGDVHIVLTNVGAVGESTSVYSNGVSPETAARKIREVARKRDPARSDADLDRLLCRRLHVAPFRFGPDATWPKQKPIGNHGKFWMVDDRAFYIGSDNLYPIDLQEFGYIVDDRAAAATALRDYWEPLWRWSRAAAVSGADAPACIFAATTK
jgi:phosphatidylserine/phosphatidylglycerophosphate/cardiolipin synthase-like enzyme